MRQVTVAAIQMACSWNLEQNLATAERLIRETAARGAQIVLLQELFATPYFCQEESAAYFKYATLPEANPAVLRCQALARELGVVLPVSFFERSRNVFYNSVAIIDADGKILGIYRKTHIPCGPGYEEKFYFHPGDTGFQVWQTRYARIGVGICWDQWFPEAARCMALQGAELLLYPTAIGSEPSEADIDSKSHWQTCMQGHAAANIMPVIAANRIGTETLSGSSIGFYGSSFITDHTGTKVAEADRGTETILTASFDLDAIEQYRISWGVFRDRRPEMYRLLLTADGASSREPKL